MVLDLSIKEAKLAQKPFALSLKVVVRDNVGRCLLLKRSPSSKGNPGKWDFPGGKLEPGEDFDAGLLREVAEETGIVIGLDKVAGTGTRAGRIRDARLVQFHLYPVIGSIGTGALTA